MSLAKILVTFNRIIEDSFFSQCKQESWSLSTEFDLIHHTISNINLGLSRLSNLIGLPDFAPRAQLCSAASIFESGVC